MYTFTYNNLSDFVVPSDDDSLQKDDWRPFRFVFKMFLFRTLSLVSLFHFNFQKCHLILCKLYYCITIKLSFLYFEYSISFSQYTIPKRCQWIDIKVMHHFPNVTSLNFVCVLCDRNCIIRLRSQIWAAFNLRKYKYIIKTNI